MDIRSIIDSDASSTAPRRSAPNQQQEKGPEHQYHTLTSQRSHESYPPVYNGRRETRPPQPPPLQPPAHSELRSPGSVSYSAAPSPYQQLPVSAAGNGQYPFPPNANQSPIHSFHPPQFQQRESSTPSVDVRYQVHGQPTSLPQTPTAVTPGSAHSYSQPQRPPSSHSATTPTSAKHQVSTLLRDSPQVLHTQARGPPQPYINQQYLSQPGTPLGPPPAYGRPPMGLRRESSDPYDHGRTHSSGSLGNQSVSALLPSTELHGSLGGPHPSIRSQRPPPASQTHVSHNGRERSLSVSPKTRLPSQASIEAPNWLPDQTRSLSCQMTPAKRKIREDRSDSSYGYSQPQEQTQSRTSSIGVNSILNVPPADEVDKENKEYSFSGRQPTNSLANIVTDTNHVPYVQKQQNQTSASCTPISASGPSGVPIASSRPVSRDMAISGSSSATLIGPQSLTPQLPSHQPSPAPHAYPDSPASLSVPVCSSSTMPPKSITKLPIKTENLDTKASSAVSSLRAVRKRLRPGEIPIFAQSIRKAGRGASGHPLPPNRPAKGIGAPVAKQETDDVKKLPPQQQPSQPINEEVNGHARVSNEGALLPTQPQLGNRGPLGPWEPSFLNTIPYDEVTRRISDFLFQEVVLRGDVGTGPAGGIPGPDAVLEIEAKIGHLIDKHTNDRLRLPVMTECVLDKRDPSLRVQFQSSMTEAQHRKLNQFLNRALVESKPTPTKSRIPMDYIHKRECDTFYELSQAGMLNLPGSIRGQLNPRHNNAKVRITTDQKTGEVKAKIVKVRVADIDVFSPLAAFDWRVSVNLEMNFDGDMKDLIEPTSLDGRRPDRNKDRVSYKHLFYTIDLTQVTSADASSKTEKEHELEIEISADEVKRQGQLLQANQTSQYEDLVRGFADNVRILVRHCK